MEAGQLSQVLYSMFLPGDTSSATCSERNQPAKALIRFRFVAFSDRRILQCSKTRLGFIIKISLANFSSRATLIARAESSSGFKESQNGLENTEDRRSAVRHGDQHVCGRDPQVICGHFTYFDAGGPPSPRVPAKGHARGGVHLRGIWA